MPATRPTAVAYCRVSSLEQAREGVSLDAQESRLAAYATAKGLDLVAIIRDEGMSAKTLQRPGLARVILTCTAHQTANVLVVKLDRLSRRTRDLLYLVEDVFEKNGVALHSLGEAVDTSSAGGRFFLRLMASLAEMEREQIVERTCAALAFKRARGDRLGTTPLGYTTPGPGLPLVELPAEQKVVRRIRALRGGGASFRQIADTLQHSGTPTKRGGHWHASTVRAVCCQKPRIHQTVI